MLFPPWRSVVFYSSALALLLCFFLQVDNQVFKYMNKDSTVVTKITDQPGLLFPSITFCPGFKQVVVRQTPWLMTKWNHLELTPEEVDAFPSSAGEMDKFWAKATQPLDDVVSHIKIIDKNYDEDTFFTESLEQQLASPHQASRMTVASLNTTDGVCYTVRMTAPLARETYLLVEFDLSGMESMAVYLHDRENTMGLNSNYWFHYPSVSYVKYGKKRNLIMNKVVFNRTLNLSEEEGESAGPLGEDDYFACLRQYVHGLILDDSTLQEIRERKPAECSNASLCHSPFFDLLQEGSSGLERLPSCDSFNSWRCMSLLSSLALDRTQGNGGRGCSERRGQVVDWEVDDSMDRGTILKDENRALLKVSYESLTERVQREYLLLDLGAIVGVLGGSLGMFVGLSFLDGVRFVIAGWERLLQKRK